MKKSLTLKISQMINQAVSEKLKGAAFNDGASFVGYNPLEKIKGSLFQWIAVPFSGTEVFCQLRCPNATQLEQCGDFSNIIIESEGKKMEYDDILKIRNYQENICKLVFNIPAFDEIAKVVGQNDFVLSEKKKELEELTKKFETHKEEMSETEKETLSARLRAIELQLGYILPDDTMAFITKWAMGNDVSDIKRITKEKFLQAAALAKANNKAPSDYLSGVFTDFNRHEVDAYAAVVLDEYIKENQTVSRSAGIKYKWVGGAKNKDTPLPKKAGET